jgi:hypothetical protein
LVRAGTRDRYVHEAGSQEFVRGRLGLTVESIVESVCAALDRTRAIPGAEPGLAPGGKPV